MGVIIIPTVYKYRYTTGPISVGENADNIRVVLLNNGTKSHKAVIKIYNLDPSPKKLVFNETFNISPGSKAGTEYIPSFNYFEVQILADSAVVLAWVGGRSGNENLVGNVVLHSELVRL